MNAARSTINEEKSRYISMKEESQTGRYIESYQEKLRRPTAHEKHHYYSVSGNREWSRQRLEGTRFILPFIFPAMHIE